jgi:hypothetical protein
MQRGTHYGPRNWPPFFAPRLHFFRESEPPVSPTQATATLQWNAFLESRCPAGRRVLRINMDETSVRLFHGGGKGCVATENGALANGAGLEQAVTLRARRGAVSLVAFVCDDALVQRRLPQIVIASEKILPVKEAAVLCAAPLAGHTLVLRRRSAWLDTEGLKEVLRILRRCLEPVMSSCWVILSMDACPVHISPAIVKTANRLGFHYLLIAASTTKWLQPLDVAVFGPLKHRLRALFAQRQLELRRAELTAVEMLPLLARACEEVLQTRNWSDAFRRCGLLGGWPRSARFQRASAVAAPPVVSTELPTLEQLQSLYPRNKYIPVDALFAPLLREPVEHEARLSPAVARPSPSAASAGPSDPERPWLGRLRSSSRASLESSQPETASPGHPPSSLHTPAAARSRLIPVGVPLALPWPARAALPQPAVRPRPSE